MKVSIEDVTGLRDIREYRGYTVEIRVFEELEVYDGDKHVFSMPRPELWFARITTEGSCAKGVWYHDDDISDLWYHMRTVIDILLGDYD